MASRTTKTGNCSQCWTLKSMGDKNKGLIVKLQETHRKDKFLFFTEDGKIILLETFSKKSVEIKSMFKYS
eukprot:2692164-Ditylum_brightwellii.AAC.1